MANLVGHQLRKDADIANSIESLVKQVAGFSDQIKSPKGPEGDCEAANKQMVDEFGQNRGRPLFYPYIGTGAGRAAESQAAKVHVCRSP